MLTDVLRKSLHGSAVLFVLLTQKGVDGGERYYMHHSAIKEWKPHRRLATGGLCVVGV